MQHRYFSQNAIVNIESALKAFLLTHSIQTSNLQKCHKQCTDLLLASTKHKQAQCVMSLNFCEQFNSFDQFEMESFANGSRWTQNGHIH